MKTSFHYFSLAEGAQSQALLTTTRAIFFKFPQEEGPLWYWRRPQAHGFSLDLFQSLLHFRNYRRRFLGRHRTMSTKDDTVRDGSSLR